MNHKELTRRRFVKKFADFFTGYDVLLSPVLNQPAPKLGEQAPTVDFDTLWDRTLSYASYTPPCNVAGIPAISVPLHWSQDGLPIGSHFAAAIGGGKLLLELAYALEEARPWADIWAPNSARYI